MPHVMTRRRTHKGILFTLLVTCGISVNAARAVSHLAETGSAGSNNAPGQEVTQHLNIRISIGSTIMTATLEDNPTARDFVTLLPLTKRLSEEGAPATSAGAVGDIAYYAPWGNIAFYRGKGPDASGVIKIARITFGIEALKQSGQVRVTISRAN